MKGNFEGGITVSLPTTAIHEPDSTVSSTDQLSTPYTSLAGDIDSHFKIEQQGTPLGSTALSSVDSFESGAGGQSRSLQPEPGVDLGSIQPDTPLQGESTICVYSSDADTASSV